MLGWFPLNGTFVKQFEINKILILLGNGSTLIQISFERLQTQFKTMLGLLMYEFLFTVSNAFSVFLYFGQALFKIDMK